MKRSAVQRADHHLLAVLRRRGADPRVASAAKGLSWAGEHAAVWLAAGLAGACADPPRRAAWLRATTVVAASHATSMALKRIVRRPRPHLPGAAPLVRTAGHHSFPSSHAASATAAAIAFTALLPRAPFPPLAAAMCLSRLVAGVHYPTDVACGALLGAMTARAGRTWTLNALPGAAGDTPMPPTAGAASVATAAFPALAAARSRWALNASSARDGVTAASSAAVPGPAAGRRPRGRAWGLAALPTGGAASYG